MSMNSSEAKEVTPASGGLMPVIKESFHFPVFNIHLRMF